MKTSSLGSPAKPAAKKKKAAKKKGKKEEMSGPNRARRPDYHKAIISREHAFQ
jgi:hypothetical protein